MRSCRGLSGRKTRGRSLGRDGQCGDSLSRHAMIEHIARLQLVQPGSADRGHRVECARRLILTAPSALAKRPTTNPLVTNTLARHDTPSSARNAASAFRWPHLPSDELLTFPRSATTGRR